MVALAVLSPGDSPRLGERAAWWVDQARAAGHEARLLTLSGNDGASGVLGSLDAREQALVLHDPDLASGLELVEALELAGRPVLGCASQALAVCDDRELSKLAAARLGARCAGHEEVGERHRPYWTILQRVGLPCQVRPVRRGAPATGQRVADEAGLRPAVDAARARDPGGRCLVEELVPGAPHAVLVVPDPSGQPRSWIAPEPGDGAREAAGLSARLAAGLGVGGPLLVRWILPEDGGRALFLEADGQPAPEDLDAACSTSGRSTTQLIAALLGPTT